MSLPPQDNGPWRLSDQTGRYLQSDDFAHDVRLQINGDFANDLDRLAYATWLILKLNDDGRACREAALEEAASIFHPTSIEAAAIRSLKNQEQPSDDIQEQR